METLEGLSITAQAAQAAGWMAEFIRDGAAARRIAAELVPFEDCQLSYQRGLEGELYTTLKMHEFFRAGGDPVKHAIMEWDLGLAEVQSTLTHVSANLNESLRGGRNRSPADLADFADEIPEFPREKVRAKWQSDPPPRLVQQIDEIIATDWNKASREAAEDFGRDHRITVTTWEEFKRQRPGGGDAAGPDSGQKPKATVADVLLINVFSCIARIRLTRTTLLLRAWMADHGGRLPDTLDVLVPDDVSEIPADPYNGQPLRYDKEKIWSIGSDLKEDGNWSRDDHVQLL
jgi:hypothetical protein